MDSSSNSSDDYHMETSEDENNVLVNFAVKNSYSAYSEEELDYVYQKERELGFRKLLIRKKINILYKIRFIVDTLLNKPSSSILV